MKKFFFGESWSRSECVAAFCVAYLPGLIFFGWFIIDKMLHMGY